MKTPLLTEEDKSRIISSVYSNPKKLMIATQIYAKGEMSTQDLAEKIGLKPSTVNEYLKDMLQNGILESRRHSYYIYYSLTDLGKKLVTLFN